MHKNIHKNKLSFISRIEIKSKISFRFIVMHIHTILRTRSHNCMQLHNMHILHKYIEHSQDIYIYTLREMKGF